MTTVGKKIDHSESLEKSVPADHCVFSGLEADLGINYSSRRRSGKRD
jgi:hypothetical protein